jgi:uncharacterized damage-inducible protein DinB
MRMMLEQYRALAGYNTWMNARLYALAATLSDAERRQDRGAFFKSIHGTFNHLLLTDRAWLHRFTGDPAVSRSLDRDGRPISYRGLDQDLYEDFELLRAERAKTDTHIEVWVAGLDEARLTVSIRYRTTAGVAHEHALWPALTHFFNHQTHHRGQVTTLFTQLGRDPGVTDLIAYFRDHRESSAAPG